MNEQINNKIYQLLSYRQTRYMSYSIVQFDWFLYVLAQIYELIYSTTQAHGIIVKYINIIGEKRGDERRRGETRGEEGRQGKGSLFSSLLQPL